MLEKGTRVRQKVAAPIEGEVVKVVRDAEGEPTGQYLVEWKAKGAMHSRHFTEDQVDVVAKPKPQAKANSKKPSRKKR